MVSRLEYSCLTFGKSFPDEQSLLGLSTAGASMCLSVRSVPELLVGFLDASAVQGSRRWQTLASQDFLKFLTPPTLQ